MASTWLVVLFAAVIMVLPSSFSSVEGAVSCGQVGSSLAPCLPYVMNRGPLLGGCCGGVKTLNGLARTTPDRQSVCSCLKQLVAGSYRNINFSKAAALPGQCGVSLPYKISPSTDCSKVR